MNSGSAPNFVRGRTLDVALFLSIGVSCGGVGYEWGSSFIVMVVLHELRRLAMRYVDYFSTFCDLLEPTIGEITVSNRVDGKLQMELTSILLVIMQRARYRRASIFLSLV